MQIKTAIIIWVSLLILVLGTVAVVLLVFNRNNPEDAFPLVGTDPEDREARQELSSEDDLEDFEPYLGNFSYELVVGGDIVLTAAEYNFYFNDIMFMRYDFYMRNFNVEPFDITESLEHQMHWDDEISWADYFHNAVEQTILQYIQAVASGYYLDSDARGIVDGVAEWLESLAEEEGQTVDEMVGDVFDGMTGEMYLRYVERDILIDRWRASQVERLNFTDTELVAFYDENWMDINPWGEGDRENSETLIDVRHILIMFPVDASEEVLAEHRQRAQEIYEEWQAGDATEDSFATLAALYTDDGGSVHNGGLYTNVTQGQMVPEFDAWIFDPLRQFGDTDIVETQFGAHIMFFVQSSKEWMLMAEAAKRAQAMENILNEIANEFVVERRIV